MRHAIPALEAIDQSGKDIARSCGAYLASKMNHGKLARVDPEEIRALTQGMRRESWQPPKGDKAAIVKAYLLRHSPARANELKRFGVTPESFGIIAKRLGARAESVFDGHSMVPFYSLKGA